MNAGFVGEILSHAKTSKFPPAELKTSFMVRVLGEDQVVCYHLMAFTSRNWLKRYSWFTKPLNLFLDARHQQVPGEDLRQCFLPWAPARLSASHCLHRGKRRRPEFGNPMQEMVLYPWKPRAGNEMLKYLRGSRPRWEVFWGNQDPKVKCLTSSPDPGF